jgi:carboxylesterase
MPVFLAAFAMDCMRRESMQEEFLKNPQLEGDSFFWEGSDTGLLLVHGFTATTAEVRPLAKIIHAAGYTVSGPLLPGHKTNLADMNGCRWMDWYHAVEQAYLDLRQRCAHVLVGGESMGALLTLQLASQHAEIGGVVSYAPALRVKYLSTAFLIAPIMPVIVSRGEDDGLPWQGYTARPMKAVTQLFRLQQVVRRSLPRVTSPVAIFQGRMDQTIDPRSAEEVYRLVGSQDKTLHWFDRSPHCMILAQDLDEIARRTLEFIRAKTG